MPSLQCHYKLIILFPLLIIGLTGCSNSHHSFFANDHTDYYQTEYYFPETREATGHSVFIFDPKYTSYALYDEDGHLVQQGRASGGQFFCADTGRACTTPAGTYRIYRKHGEDCKSSKFPLGRGGAPMPHCMFFTGGYAIHGSNDVPDHNASHGCIRVPPGDAAWLSEYHLEIGDTVIVRSYYHDQSDEDEFDEVDIIDL